MRKVKPLINGDDQMDGDENNENRFAHRASGVEDLEHALLAVDLDLLPVGVLDGGVVLLHEYPLDKLDCQGRLAHPSTTQHHYLVFPHRNLNCSLKSSKINKMICIN